MPCPQKYTHLQTATSKPADQSLQKGVLFSSPRKIVFKNFRPLKNKNTQPHTP